MRRSKASRARARDAKHVRLYLYMLKSAAWCSLSCPARCLLIEMQALYNGTNNGELFMSVRSAATALGTGTKQASAAFRELADRGFIRATRKGSRTRRGEVRMATCWRLTEYDDDLTGRQPSKEFMTWTPPEKNSTVVSETTHRGLREHGARPPTPQNAPDRGLRQHGNAVFEPPTVVSGNTQLVNHVGAPETEQPKSEPERQAALARLSQSAIGPCAHCGLDVFADTMSRIETGALLHRPCVEYWSGP
jgi:hypothetical protein